MRRVLITGLSGCAAVLAIVSLMMHSAPEASTRRPMLAGGATSVDALLDQFLDAVAANDEVALHHLRVTETEYRSIIVPGTVDVGAPPRHVTPKITTFFWHMLDAKSRDFAYQTLSEFGGQHLQRRSVSYTKGIRKFGGYTAYGDVHLEVATDEGKELQVRSGTIAEVDGRYKFIGLNWAD